MTICRRLFPLSAVPALRGRQEVMSGPVATARRRRWRRCASTCDRYARRALLFGKPGSAAKSWRYGWNRGPRKSRQKPRGTAGKAYKSRQMPTKAYTVKNVGFCRLLSAFVGFRRHRHRGVNPQSRVIRSSLKAGLSLPNTLYARRESGGAPYRWARLWAGGGCGRR